MFFLQNISVFGGHGTHSKKGPVFFQKCSGPFWKKIGSFFSFDTDLFLKNLKHCLFFNGLYLFLQMEKPFKTTYRYPCMSNLFCNIYVNKIQMCET